MTIQQYIDNVSRTYASGIATEHSFRGDLKTLLESLVPSIAATNEPKRIECGAPDYVLTQKDIPVGYIEAKDIGVDLDGKNLKEQFDRYKNALDNLAFTDYLDFRFYSNGQLTAKIKIGEVQNGRVVPLTENFEQFTNLIKEFCSRTTVTIKSSKRLAEMMAEKAKILAYIIKNALDEDIAAGVESDLTNQMKAFKDILIHDIDPKAFADIYAQTIAYGMFAARLHDTDLGTFSRAEAAEKIPKTNPFLRKLFQFIAAFDLDTRIDWIVDALADLFRATDIAAILKNFGKSTQTHDPIMHFYETFLAEYDPKLRKSRGVFYTPEPVVDFIVRAVDDILKTEFNLPSGLADTSKTKIKLDVQGKIREQEVHRVQILDPATGTGTFLASVIKHIYKRFEGQQGIWDQYVDEHLIPRLNGFELLMASYAMAHLKLDLLLTETGYKSGGKGSPPYEGGVAPASGDGVVLSSASDQRSLNVNVENHPVSSSKPELPPLLRKEGSRSATQRFQIYLTNALEEYHPDTGTLFASWLSTEANEANHIKRDTPVMVVIGNPPYSVSSSNKSEWIENLTADYKRDLNERNIQPLSDDYIKFIRFGQHFVDKNGEGLLAYISNNSFISGLIHRQMRKSLVESFDKIYILDLHGNSKTKEAAPDGSTDENVFDIMQGVSINIFVKTGQKAEGQNAEVYHFDLQGSRAFKYRFLEGASIASVAFEHQPIIDDTFKFKFLAGNNDYLAFLDVNELFVVKSMGVYTARDGFLINMHKGALVEDISVFCGDSSDDEIIQRFGLKDTGTFNLSAARKTLGRHDRIDRDVKKYSCRPFDERYIFYNSTLVERSRPELMANLDGKQNVALSTCRNNRDESHTYFISKQITDKSILSSLDNAYVYPLYQYANDKAQQSLEGSTARVPNLDLQLVSKIAAAIGLTFTNEKEETDGTFSPIDILDYIYAVLHSPSYREKYKEFLKVDFPRVPYPRDASTFWELVALGGELRQIHLLESPKVNEFITRYEVGGGNLVMKVEYRSSPPYEGGVAAATPLLPEEGWHRFGDGVVGGDGVVLSTASDQRSLDANLENHPVSSSKPELPPLLRKEGSRSLGRVYFNATQYFEGVPEIAWNFYIGGYQPAQKWLKDRKGRTLDYDDIQHYQKIIVALTETDRIMKEIDKIEL